jgi:hypothetical protein
MVRNSGLREIEERHQLADADLAGVLAKHVDQLHPDRVPESLGHLGHTLGLGALDVGIDDRLTTGLAVGTLGLRSELQIDRHLSTYID